MNRFEFYGNLNSYKKKQDELKHYGIIGQKWGQRRWQNSDGTFNEAGKERYFGSGEKVGSKESRQLKKQIKEGKKLEKRLEKTDYVKRKEIINEIVQNEKYKDLFNKIDEIDSEKNEENLKRTDEIFEDFEDEETKRLATAGIMNMLNNGYYQNPTMEDLANCAWFYAYEDGNQGGNTAEYLYATIDKGISRKELDDLYMNLHNHKNSKEDGINILKENPVLSNVNDKYLKDMIEKKLDDKYDSRSYWNLYAACEDDREPDAKQKSDYAKAKNIVSKLDESCGDGDGWDFLNEAIENLDLSATELKNMTQADWDKVNAEVNRLMGG